MAENNKRGVSDTDFTSLTFDEIKKRLVTRAKTYYPDTYQDFNDTSFGSMMMDMIALVSEQLNFYTQFVANENYVETMRTSQGLASAAAKEGVQISNKYTSVGTIKVFCRIPADSISATPDLDYQFTLLRGSTFSNDSGAVFTSTDDVPVNLDPSNVIGTEFTDDATRITYYVLPLKVPVESGEERIISAEIKTYRKFLKLEIKDTTVSSITKVVDSNGNEYYEVPNLSQDVIYREVQNMDATDISAPSKLVPIPAPRRFEVRHEGSRTFLVFGFGSESELKVRDVANPSDLALQRTGRSYVSDIAFDPSRLLSNNKFGVSPQNTTLTISYKSNTSDNSNAAVGTIKNVVSSEMLFEKESELDESKIAFIQTSLSCENEEPINGSIEHSSTQDVSETIRAARGNRGRAVTLQDYVSLCYTMPSKFGSVYRASVSRDKNDLKRNINLFIISQDSDGFLEPPSSVLKTNLKRWLNEGRMISDTVDIFPAKVLNFGIFFDVVLNTKVNKVTALSAIRSEMFEKIKLSAPQIGEYFSIGEIEKILNAINIVSRVNSIKIVNRSGSKYSGNRYDIVPNISNEGGLIYIPQDCIWEIKYENDITGKIQ